MSANNEYRGERLSFFKLFSQKNYKLVVPIIQRDYAQGRTNNDTEEIREEFLDALYRYLEENRPNKDLDFVYGTLLENTNEGCSHFIPLDGQQRLTTLFLLHWFLSQISLNEEAKKSFKAKMTIGDKSRFTYETRQSSTDFCDALMQASIPMDRLLPIQGTDTPSLSATLANERWFFRCWKNDPTIQSMLVMLDAIYRKFQGHGEFFERLLDEQNPIITFIFLDLKRYKLTDDLYIKMNSRGKPLSTFENFKAKFEQYLKNLTKPDGARGFRLKFREGEKDVSLEEYFSFKIDTEWLTFLWQYCSKDDKKQDKLDSYIQNLFRVIVTNHYASVVDSSSKGASDETDPFKVLTGKESSLSFARYEKTGVLTYDAIMAVIDSLDALCNGNQKIAHYISEDYKYYYDEDAIFIKAINNDLSLAERMQFFAYVQYLIKHKDKKDGLNEWMRVIHNLTHPNNTITDSNDDLARGIKSIRNLTQHAPNIIDHLRRISDIEGFSKHQSREECIKAHLVAKTEEWRELIESTEKHPYFNGQIGFLLEFSGICEYYRANRHLNWSESDNETFNFKGSFRRYSEIGSFIFAFDTKKKKRINNEDFRFERAVLAHGDYLLKKNTNYRNLLSTDTVADNIQRDFSWRRLLRMGDERMEIVKETFGKIIKATSDTTAPKDIKGALKALCIPQTEDAWRNTLISSPEMFEPCEQGFIYMDNPDVDYPEILLIKKKSLGSYHWELFTYHLWKKKFENASLEEFFKAKGFCAQYKAQANLYDNPHISITDKGKMYIEIRTKLKKVKKGDCYQVDFHQFQIKLYNNENNFDVPDEMTQILEKWDFRKNEKDERQWDWYCDSEDSAFNRTKELVGVLYSLKLKQQASQHSPIESVAE
ncbi:MAG: DUF262 domain-containing protein [Akkermansia sp.]